MCRVVECWLHFLQRLRLAEQVEHDQIVLVETPWSGDREAKTSQQSHRRERVLEVSSMHAVFASWVVRSLWKVLPIHRINMVDRFVWVDRREMDHVAEEPLRRFLCG